MPTYSSRLNAVARANDSPAPDAAAPARRTRGAGCCPPAAPARRPASPSRAPRPRRRRAGRPPPASAARRGSRRDRVFAHVCTMAIVHSKSYNRPCPIRQRSRGARRPRAARRRVGRRAVDDLGPSPRLPVRVGHALRALRAGSAAAAALPPGRAHQEPARRSARQPVRGRSVPRPKIRRRARASRCSAGCHRSRARTRPTRRTRYLTAWPRAADYLALGDFSFWRLEIEEARLIAGFGEIRWLDGAALREPSQPKTRVSRRRVSRNRVSRRRSSGCPTPARGVRGAAAPRGSARGVPARRPCAPARRRRRGG